MHTTSFPIELLLTRKQFLYLYQMINKRSFTVVISFLFVFISQFGFGNSFTLSHKHKAVYQTNNVSSLSPSSQYFSETKTIHHPAVRINRNRPSFHPVKSSNNNSFQGLSVHTLLYSSILHDLYAIRTTNRLNLLPFYITYHKLII